MAHPMGTVRISLGTPDRRWAWTVSGERHQPNSSPEYMPEEACGTVAAESAGEALVLIVTGLGPDGPGGPDEHLENTIPWDLISGDRPITIVIEPIGDEQPDTTAGSAGT